MNNPVGPLVAADEGFTHQIAETFATVGTSDPSWTEKVCAMAAARDGSLQLGFGLGKYPNRNVMDGYAGVSRGVEQLTVRASRRLSPEPELTVIGPVRYEVLEPLKVVRFALDANDEQPIGFDWVFESALPPVTEDRTHQFSPSGYRISAELVRYHQIGVASGWVEVDGERTEITPDTWISTRDHSWGVRYDVGQPATDIEQVDMLEGLNFTMFWCPMLLERPDGSRYGLFFHLVQVDAPGLLHKVVTGGVEHPDGRFEPFIDVRPEVRYDPVTRRMLGGQVHLAGADGAARTITLEVPTDTGFHLGAGGYFGWHGHHHGDWRGPLHVDSERLADCTEPTLARELHQIRDTFVLVDDPVGGGRGWGNCQPIITGVHPDLGLDAAGTFW